MAGSLGSLSQLASSFNSQVLFLKYNQYFQKKKELAMYWHGCCQWVLRSISQIQLRLHLCTRCSADAQLIINITSCMLPFSIWTIPVSARVLRHPTISEIIINLSFGTSLVNGLCPTHASLLSISDYGYTQSRYHMIQFPLPHKYFISPYACFILPCGSLYLIFLFPCACCHITNLYVSAFII